MMQGGARTPVYECSVDVFSTNGIVIGGFYRQGGDDKWHEDLQRVLLLIRSAVSGHPT
jgi:hypothetical protein